MTTVPIKQPELVYLDPARVAAAIGGKAKGNKITAHAPGHKKGAPELEILIEPTAPRGLLVRCYSGEDPVAMKDWILRQCGEPDFAPTQKAAAPTAHLALLKPKASPKRFYDGHLIEQGYTAVAEYDYADPHGEVMFQVVRYEGEGLPKTFLQRHPDSRGGWLSGRGEPILYRWPEIASRPSEPVYVTEGEKDADALAALGLLATTAPNGSWPEDVSPLKGRKVFVIPDNDEAGEKKAAAAIEKLMGVATVHRVDLPGLPHKGDVSDWLAAGGTIDQLKALADSAPPVAANENSPGARFKVDWFGDIEEDLPKETFIKGVFGVGEFTMLSGKPGTGKSVVVTDMACHVAAGKDWDGRKVKQGLVVYVAAERKDLTKRRMLAFRKTHGLGHIPLAVISGRIDMTTGLKDAEELSAAITKLEQDCGQKCSWVIIDTLTRVFGPGDQNASKDMGRFIASCDTIMESVGAALTVIHHTGHQGDRAKGAIDLDGAVDASFMVKKEAGGYILECDGANDSAEGVIARFKMEGVQVGIDEDGEPTMAPVVVPLDAKSPAERLVENASKHHTTALDVLKRLSADEDGHGVPRADWQAAYYAEYPDEGNKESLRARFNRAVKWLAQQGMANEVDGHWHAD